MNDLIILGVTASVVAAVTWGVWRASKRRGELERERVNQQITEARAEAKSKEAEIFRQPRGSKEDVISRL